MSQEQQRLLGQLESAIADIDRLAAQDQRRRAGRDDQRARAARQGTLGQDWQEVQRRIDAGRTSLADVFSGRDETPAARRLLALSHATIDRLSAELDPPAEVREDLAVAEAEWQRLRGGPGVPPRDGDAP